MSLDKKEIAKIIIAIIALIVATIVQNSIISLIIYIIGYIVVGIDVVFEALKNLFKGKVFRRRFLNEYCDYWRICDWGISRSCYGYASI